MPEQGSSSAQSSHRPRSSPLGLVKIRTFPADLGKLAVAFLTLNARKSWHRRQGRPGPCQHPSDSGRAGETQCDALAGWRHPSLLRVACPHLRHYAGRGWRCSVHQADVRPFWPRALLAGTLAGGCLYLGGAVALYGGARACGYQVPFREIAWPPAWGELRKSRSAFFLDKARAALAAHDPATATLNLASASHIDPDNFAASLLLAQLNRTAQPRESDARFRTLLLTHPAQAETTARAWLPGLLARGDFINVRELAIQRLLANDCPDTAGWQNAWVFATTHLAAPPNACSYLSEPILPTSVHDTFALATALSAASSRAECAGILISREPNLTDPVSVRWHVHWHYRYGDPKRSLALLDQAAGAISHRDALLLRLAALATAGRNAEVEALIAPLRGRELTPAGCEFLCVHLLRHPQEPLRRALFARLRQAPDTFSSADSPALLALFCVAARARDREGMEFAAAEITRITGVPFHAAEPIARALGSEKVPPPAVWLPLVQPISLETLYALVDVALVSQRADPLR